MSAQLKCEGCGEKVACFGLPSNWKKRWCASCGKGHAGAVNVADKKCEGCGVIAASFGLPSDGKRCWSGLLTQGARGPGPIGLTIPAHVH